MYLRQDIQPLAWIVLQLVLLIGFLKLVRFNLAGILHALEQT